VGDFPGQGDVLEAIKHLLWDVDPGTIDPQKHKKFIIERVLKFGTPKEVRWLLATYTEAEIIQVVKTSRNLDRKTANFWAVHFGIPSEEILCLNMPLLQSCFY
jgi:hypothetical protein